MKKYIIISLAVIAFIGIYLLNGKSLGITQAINGQPAVYNATAPTLEDQQGAALNVDVNGNLKVIDYSAGGSFSSATNASSTVGTTAVQILAASATRQYALFTNDSDTVIYLNLGASSTAAIGKGMRLNANGGSYEISSDNLYIGIISAISSADTKNLTVVYK